MRRKVAVLVEKGKINLVEEEVPSLGREDVLIKVGACGICTGDLYGFSGYPVWFKLPSPLGHEPSGEVVEVGNDVTRFSKGDHVTALGGPGFSDFVLVNESYVEKVPENVPFECVIGEPLACVVNAVRLIYPKIGDNVAVVGTGFMGLLLIQALSHLSLSVLVGVDLNNERLRLAKHYGANMVLNPSEGDIAKETLVMTDGKGFDTVIEATGDPRGVGLATRLVRRRGKLAIFSYHPNPVSVDLREWDSKGLEVIMTNPSRAEDMRDNLKIAVRMMSRGVFNLEKLITHKWVLNDIQKAFEYASKKPGDYIKGVIVP
jgi:2-desacetyl-2-hydroxyethyl bacteriochlorophyllide A dehydrogenase